LSGESRRQAVVGAQEAIEYFVFFFSGFFFVIAGTSASCVAVRRVSSWMCVPVLLRFFLDVRDIAFCIVTLSTRPQSASSDTITKKDEMEIKSG
jgi:hypothetical protein